MLCGTETGRRVGLGATGEQGRGGAAASKCGRARTEECLHSGEHQAGVGCMLAQASVGAFFLMVASSGNAVLKPRHLEFRLLKALVYHITAEVS